MSKFTVHAIANRHFREIGSGTLVTDRALFWAALEKEKLPDPSIGEKDGQVMVEIPVECVSSAFARLGDVDENDVRATVHRGAVEPFVPRELYDAVPVSSARAIVYTAQAIKDDPDWDGVEPENDYVVVTVLAQVSTDGSDPQSPHRFTGNLAGGNKRYVAPEYTLEVARKEAAEVKKFAELYIKLG